LHVLTICNRAEHESQSSGTNVRFRAVLIADQEFTEGSDLLRHVKGGVDLPCYLRLS